MKQRKIWALLLAAALLAVLTACGAARETNHASTTAQAGDTSESTAAITTSALETPETTVLRETEQATEESSGEAPESTAPQSTEQPSTEPSSEAPVITAPQPTEPEPSESQRVETTERNVEKMLQMKIGGTAVRVNWENNRSVEALKALCENGPLVIQMSMYGGFEQVGPIGSRLPSDDVQTTTAAGDIVLYSSNQIVVFYGSNSWAYTRLGHITDRDAAGMAALLGNGNVTITISMEEVG